ncbi:MAG: glyoxalase superfamily protein [Spirochaetota bacterium]
MKEIKFISITPILCVTDLPKSLKYYEEVLQFCIDWTWSEDEDFAEGTEPTFACVCQGDIAIFLCQQGQGNPGAWLTINVATIEELHSLYLLYKENKAVIRKEPQDYPWGMREMIVEDLDGNTLRVGCSIGDE